MTSKNQSISNLLLVALLIFAPLRVVAADPHPEVSKFIVDSIVNRLDVEVTKLRHSSLKAVFSCEFFAAKPWMVNPDGSRESSSNYVVSSSGGKLAILEKPNSDEASAKLLACMNNSFVVASDEQATTLMNALAVLFDSRSSSFDNRVVKSDDGWALITGKSFGELRGYQVLSDGSGKVTKILTSSNLGPE